MFKWKLKYLFRQHWMVFFTEQYKKAQLSLTNPRDACEKFAWFT